jgi:DNA-binding transcriptional regulator LsrR (DeoR family)
MSKLLESWRWEHRLNKAGLGRILGISRQVIHNWIKYGIPQGKIKNVSNITGIPEDDLISELSEMTGIDKNKLKKESEK